jgi:hypothetical protein
VSARVYISRDSGALCVGAEEVATAFRKAAEKRGLSVEIVRTGSRGMYWLEPLVEVETPQGRVGYGPVRVADVDGLLDEGEKHRLCLGLVEDIPWLKSQIRLTFARCGIVDPRSLEDYRAHKGYKGLEKALQISREAIVEEVVNSGLRGRGGAGFPTLPHRLGQRRRARGQDRGRRGRGRESDRAGRSVQHHEVRIALRPGRVHPLPRDERDHPLPRGFRRRKKAPRSC